MPPEIFSSDEGSGVREGENGRLGELEERIVHTLRENMDEPLAVFMGRESEDGDAGRDSNER